MFDKLKQAFSALIGEIATREISEKDLEEHLWNLQLSLIESDIAVPVAELLAENVKQSLLGLKVKRFGAKTEIEQAVKQAITC